jgi:hypothetical protein
VIGRDILATFHIVAEAFALGVTSDGADTRGPVQERDDQSGCRP